jgi:small subunit ribosomal protein S1
MKTDPPPDGSFAALFEEASRGTRPKRRPKLGETLEVLVVQIGKEAVFVELDGRHQGFLDADDLRSPDGAIRVAVGDKLHARVVDADPEQGIRLAPTVEAAVAAGASIGIGDGADSGVTKVAVGQVVQGEVTRVESYGVFLQIDGTKGRSGRGLAPVVELGLPRGADLRKAFPLGSKLKAKILEMSEGKIRLSVRALKDDEERAQFEGFREKGQGAAPRGLGTLADLMKPRKRRDVP